MAKTFTVGFGKDNKADLEEDSFDLDEDHDVMDDGAESHHDPHGEDEAHDDLHGQDNEDDEGMEEPDEIDSDEEVGFGQQPMTVKEAEQN